MLVILGNYGIENILILGNLSSNQVVLGIFGFFWVFLGFFHGPAGRALQAIKNPLLYDLDIPHYENKEKLKKTLTNLTYLLRNYFIFGFFKHFWIIPRTLFWEFWVFQGSLYDFQVILGFLGNLVILGCFRENQGILEVIWVIFL